MSFVRNRPTNQIDVLGRQAAPGPGEPFDVVLLLCYEIVFGAYHCDILCQSGGDQWGTPFFEFVSGGTGPTTGPAPAGNGHPGWVVKDGHRGEVAAAAYACPGTCDCILDKGNKINAIPDKVYDLPPELDGNVSNSNAVGSTVLSCCGVNLSPSRSAPGWGHSVEYECACDARTGKTVNCQVGCSLLE